MNSRAEKERVKMIQDRCQRLLDEMLRDDDNKYCVDCDSKGPRWASWNIGVFLCIRCAGIHRKLGVHISRVKSVNLDTWTPQQVVSLQQMGNSRARAVYEANLPDNFRRPQSDGSLENFIRAKYEHKKYIAHEWVAPPLPKVNWEAEEEAERLKRKKRETSKITMISPNNKSVATIQQFKNSASPGVSKPDADSEANTSDLLGIESSLSKINTFSKSSDSELFSNFIDGTVDASSKCENLNSAATDDSSTIAAGNSRSVEENNFFNQSLSSPNKHQQMTKDKILALYENSNVGFSPMTSMSRNTAPNQLPSQHYGNGSSLNFSSALGYRPQLLQNGSAVNTGSSFPSNPFYSMAASSTPSCYPTVCREFPNLPNSMKPCEGHQTQLQQQFGNLNLCDPSSFNSDNLAETKENSLKKSSNVNVEHPFSSLNLLQ